MELHQNIREPIKLIFFFVGWVDSIVLFLLLLLIDVYMWACRSMLIVFELTQNERRAKLIQMNENCFVCVSVFWLFYWIYYICWLMQMYVLFHNFELLLFVSFQHYFWLFQWNVDTRLHPKQHKNTPITQLFLLYSFIFLACQLGQNTY